MTEHDYGLVAMAVVYLIVALRYCLPDQCKRLYNGLCHEDKKVSHIPLFNSGSKCTGNSNEFSNENTSFLIMNEVVTN